jgi:hypothetical protein
MKKATLLTCLSLSLTYLAQAQQGSILLFGSIGFTHADDKALNNAQLQVYKQNTFTFNPGIGYQLNSHWVVGADLGYTYNDNTSNFQTGDNSSNSWYAGPFVRYYYPLSSWVSVYAQFDALYDYDAQISVFNGTTSEPVKTFSTDLFPALLFNLGKGFGLNFSLGGFTYEQTRVKGIGSTGNSFLINFGQGANFGISKNFGGQKHTG